MQPVRAVKRKCYILSMFELSDRSKTESDYLRTRPPWSQLLRQSSPEHIQHHYFRLSSASRQDIPTMLNWMVTIHRNSQYSPTLLAYLSSPATLHDRIATGSLTAQDASERRRETEKTIRRLLSGLQAGADGGGDATAVVNGSVGQP